MLPPAPCTHRPDSGRLAVERVPAALVAATEVGA